VSFISGDLPDGLVFVHDVAQGLVQPGAVDGLECEVADRALVGEQCVGDAQDIQEAALAFLELVELFRAAQDDVHLL
jgi:hypothetical protein